MPSRSLILLLLLGMVACSQAPSATNPLCVPTAGGDTRRVLARDGDVMLGSRRASDLVTLVKTRHVGEEFRRNREMIAKSPIKRG
jgi:hypothetical protein